MDSPSSSKRKLYSASAVKTSDMTGSKKRSFNSSTEQSVPSSTPPKLIDQLYHTYQSLKTERVSTSQIENSQKEQKSQSSQISTAKKAAIKLKQNSLELKSSEIKKKKTEFCKSHIAKEKDQKFIVETVNRAWEFVLLIYDDIKYMVQKEEGFDRHFSDVSDMKTVIIEKLKNKSEKLEVLSEEGNFETEMSAEKCALENLVKTRCNVKEEEEKSQDSDEVLFAVKNVEEKLNSIEGSIKNLNDKEILLENVSQKKTDQILEESSEFSQDQQKLEEEFNALETQLKDLGDVDEMKESAYLKIKELILSKINPDFSIEKNFKGEIQQLEVKIKELDLKLDLQKASVDSTNQLLQLESNLRDSKNAINFILSKNSDVNNLDKSLIELNKELELLRSEKNIATENELRSQELEDLIRKQEKNNEENVEILQELNQDLKCEREESIIRDLESDFVEKEKVGNEIFENYNNIKKVNNEHLEKNPNLLETKSLTDFASMKKKLEAAVTSAQQREKTLDKRYEIKLKELEHKSKKYLAALKEVDKEFNPIKEKTKIHDFSSLQKKIKEAEEKLKNKKKDLKKRALPVITKSEPIKIDLETLSLIKTLTKKLPEKPQHTLFSDDESIDSDVRFDRLSKTYQVQSVQLGKKQETMKKHPEKEEFLFPLTQVKTVSPEGDLNKEDFFPLFQASGLKPFSEDHSENPDEDEYSFPLTQGKNEKPSSQTSFEELRSEYVKSPKNEKRVITSSQKPSSQDSFEYETQTKEKNVARSQLKVEISTPSKGRSVKEADKERGRSTDRRFFKSSSQTVNKSYKRSKSIPPRKF